MITHYTTFKDALYFESFSESHFSQFCLTLFSFGMFLLGCNCVLPVSFDVYSSFFVGGFVLNCLVIVVEYFR